MSLPENFSYKEATSSLKALGKIVGQRFSGAPTAAKKAGKAVDVGKVADLRSQVRSTAGKTSSLGTVTTPYGGSTRYESFHRGIDIGNKIGTPIPAFTSGTVTKVYAGGQPKSGKGFGSYVIVTDPQGNRHRYSHLHDAYVREGQQVQRGLALGAMGNCFDDETEVLTEDGWKMFADLNRKERVYTLNLDTMEVEPQLPTEYVAKTYDRMIAVSNYGLDFVVSPDHRMLVRLNLEEEGRPNNELRFIKAEELLNRSYAYIPHRGHRWLGMSPTDFSLPGYRYVGDRWGTVREKPPINVDMGDWLEFLGWFLSDGSVQFNEKKRQVINACITQSPNNPKREKLLDLLNRLPFTYYDTGCDIRFGDGRLREYLMEYSRPGDKYVPSYVFQMSPELISRFLGGYGLGDGWVHKGVQSYVFGSHELRLRDQVQTLVFLAGGRAVGHVRDMRKYNSEERDINTIQPIYTLSERKAENSIVKKDQVEWVDYGREAYCVSVPNGTLYVRRGGKPMWCGNTGASYSRHGGTGSHLDYRVRDQSGSYIRPSRFIRGG